ncbi:hypothetical protein DY000_02061597 [Brassica cretica]|uniref:Peptidase M16 C-terminal domain-containing protein n=1 Tax=Brassica cretica TaxID=69181 RepID=A0ABQ7AYS2_BRACR|nr:hypothetical protein DY000_02061597 [Brassica cretica]
MVETNNAAVASETNGAAVTAEMNGTAAAMEREAELQRGIKGDGRRRRRRARSLPASTKLRRNGASISVAGRDELGRTTLLLCLFAQFFIKPLMSADATMREIKAVDSENQKNMLSDSWRLRQLQKHLSRDDHPYHKFSTGNMDTLHVRPEAKGVDTRSELLKFYDKHYSANIMHLVIYGKENLDKLQGLVEELFQEIRNTNKTILRLPGQPCTPDHLQVLVKVVPIRQYHELTVSWPITPTIHQYEEAPSRYLRHLIGHEGKGSLFHALKILGFATGLYAGEAGTMEYSFFNVSIDLTDAGHGLPRLHYLIIKKHRKLVSLQGLPTLLRNLDADDCFRRWISSLHKAHRITISSPASHELIWLSV